MDEMSYLESLLCDVFRAQGAADARGLAKRAAKDFDFDQRNKNIYELSATLEDILISERMGISLRRVQQIVKEQMEIRRKGAA